MQTELGRAIKETGIAAAAGTLFYLFAAALFAVIVRAYSPGQAVVTGVSWTLRFLAAFFFSLLFIHRGRALWKGAAAGACFTVFTLFLFAAIGGGFHLTWLFPLELLLSAAFGGIGALCGVKLRKEE